MSYEPKPSLPRPIHSPVDHYDVDVATGTVTYHVVTTNADRIRAMSDEDLAIILTESFGCPPDGEQKRCFGRDIKCYDCSLEWLKEEVQDG